MLLLSFSPRPGMFPTVGKIVVPRGLAALLATEVGLKREVYPGGRMLTHPALPRFSFASEDILAFRLVAIVGMGVFVVIGHRRVSLVQGAFFVLPPPSGPSRVRACVPYRPDGSRPTRLSYRLPPPRLPVAPAPGHVSRSVQSHCNGGYCPIPADSAFAPRCTNPAT